MICCAQLASGRRQQHPLFTAHCSLATGYWIAQHADALDFGLQHVARLQEGAGGAADAGGRAGGDDRAPKRQYGDKLTSVAAGTVN